MAALESLRGHQLAGTFTALRSLFGFAKRRRLIFADPTSRVHAGRAPLPVLLPMTDAEIAAVKKVVTTPAQRLIVTLTAIYAARAKAIRELRLDDVDHDTRHITIAGHRHRLVEFAYDVVLDWLRQRHRFWPHTTNPYLLISMGSATGTGPINDYYLT